MAKDEENELYDENMQRLRPENVSEEQWEYSGRAVLDAATTICGHLRIGGDAADVLVTLESTICAVIVACTKVGGDNIVIDGVVEGVKQRVAEYRKKHNN